MGTTIELKAADGHTLDAYRAEPSGKPRGGLVLVQEIFGVNSHIRSVADGYAGDGYLVIAPALFDRGQRHYETAYTQEDIQAGVKLMQALKWENTLADVAAAAAALKSAGKVGIVGYCWGGTVAWLAAARLPGFACAVPYYGGAIRNMIDDKPGCPVMCHWGETDHSISMEAVREIEAAHPEIVSHTYPAGHGFNCDQRGSYHAESAKRARSRTLDFLHKHIG